MMREALFQLVSDLALAIQEVLAYPENHPKVQNRLVQLHQRVRTASERLKGLNIGFFRDHVVVDEYPFVEPNSTLAKLIERMGEKGIEKVLINEGITFGELKRFVTFLGDPSPSASDRRWESIVYGKVDGTGSVEGVSLGLDSPPPSVNVLGSATEILKDIFVSMVSDGKRSKVEEGRDIVSSIMKEIGQGGSLIEHLIRLRGHDDYTVTHSLNVCILVLGQAQHLGLPERIIREIGMAGLFHDIGKEIIPSGILRKPGRLDMEEFAEVKKHPANGANLLRRIGCGSDLPMIVAFEHHIKFNRTGYPKVRSTGALHAASLMTQIADVYDALRSYRPYQPSFELDRAISIMKEGRGSDFDPVFLDRFLEVVGRPVSGAISA